MSENKEPQGCISILLEMLLIAMVMAFGCAYLISTEIRITKLEDAAGIKTHCGILHRDFYTAACQK